MLISSRIVFSFCKSKGFDFHHLWRTYDHEEGIARPKNASKSMNLSPAHREPLWQVARATSAAPIYFEAIKIGERKFLDGGMGANNPAVFAWQEIHHKHVYPPAVFVSIGTGKKNQQQKRRKIDQAKELFTSGRIDDMSRKQFLKKYVELGQLWKNFITDTEGPANTWKTMCDLTGTARARFNVEERLGEIPLDDWQPAKSGEVTLQQIRTPTMEYLNLTEIQNDIDLFAQKLVDIRHKRAETERWERFATDIKYYCPYPSCHERGYYYKKRNGLRKHFSHRHRDVLRTRPDDREADLEAFVDAGRVMTGPRSKDFEASVDRLRRAATSGLSNRTTGSTSAAHDRPAQSPQPQQVANGA